MFREWRYGISFDRSNHAVVSPDAARFVKYGHELVKELGGLFGEFRIDSLVAGDCSTQFAALAGHPLLARVRKLGLPRLSDDDAALLADRELPRLQDLQAPTSAAGLSALMRAPFAERLESLDVSGGELGEDGARALAAARLACLRRLMLSGCGLKSGIGALARAEWLPRVEVLLLAQNLIDDGDATALAHVPAPGPVELDLGDNLIEAVGLRAICAAPWRRLVSIRLRGNRLFGEEQEEHYDQGVAVWGGPRTLTPSEIAERFGFADRGVKVC